MHPTPELIRYIESQIAAGVAREAIISALRSAGWGSSAVVEAFASATAPAMPPPASISETPSQSQSDVSASGASPASTPVQNNYYQADITPVTMEKDIYPSAVAASPVIVRVSSGETATKVGHKRMSKGMTIFLIILFLIIIVGALAFLYAGQRGMTLPEYIKDRANSFLYKKEMTIPAPNPVSATEQVVSDAFARLAQQKVLETQSTAKVSLPQSTSQTGGFINQTSTPQPEGTSDANTVTPPLPSPTDVIDVRVVSQRDATGLSPRYHTMVVANSGQSVELDAEMRVVGRTAQVLLRTMTLLDTLGTTDILNTWIDIPSATTDLPRLTSIGLPGEIIEKYVARLSPTPEGSSTIMQHLIRSGVMEVSDAVRSSIIDVTAIREYDFTIQTQDLGKEFLVWMDENATLLAVSADGLRNFTNALIEVKGTITLNAETNDIMIIQVSVTGLIEKDIPFTVVTTLNFITTPTIIPMDLEPVTTPLQTVITNLVSKIESVARGDDAPAIDSTTSSTDALTSAGV